MKLESDGHPIIGHYVIGALVMKKSMPCEVAPTYVMTIIVRPLTGSPPLRLASLARSRSSQCSLANAPAGGWRSLPKRSGTHDRCFLGQREKLHSQTQE